MIKSEMNIRERAKLIDQRYTATRMSNIKNGTVNMK